MVYSFCFSSDKNPQLTEFVQQIKSNADTAALYESVRQDSTLAATPTRQESMDLSWSIWNPIIIIIIIIIIEYIIHWHLILCLTKKLLFPFCVF